MNSFSRVTQYLLLLIIISIPFSIRHVFQTPWNYETGAYSDFTSISLYISDLIVLAVIGFTWIKKRSDSPVLPKLWKYSAIGALIWIILELLIQPSATMPLRFYFSARIVLLVLLSISIARISVSREKIAWFFTILGAIQSILAGIQFIIQKSIGLYALGESLLSPEILGVAKIVSHGTKIIRGYGSFPHPNLLSAFLLAGVIFNIYLILKTYQLPRGGKKSRGIWLYITLFLNIFGIFLTFSRAGIITLLLSLTVLGCYIMMKHQIQAFKTVMIPTIIAIVISAAILAPYLMSRGGFSDQATKERVFYNQIGLSILKDKPFFGTGPGASVLHMKQYSGTQLEPWEIQPIHNYYLISAAEWGVGAIFLIILLIYPLLLLYKRKIDDWGLILALLLGSVAILFLCDHYFYTIWPTQLILWVIVGLSINYAVSHETDPTYDISSRS